MARLLIVFRLVVPPLAVVVALGCHQQSRPRPSRPKPDTVDVGYGAQAKRDVTGSVSSVNVDNVTYRDAEVSKSRNRASAALLRSFSEGHPRAFSSAGG